MNICTVFQLDDAPPLIALRCCRHVIATAGFVAGACWRHCAANEWQGQAHLAKGDAAQQHGVLSPPGERRSDLRWFEINIEGLDGTGGTTLKRQAELLTKLWLHSYCSLVEAG